MTEQRIALAGGVRTAIGKFGGSLQDISALDLGAEVVKGCLARAGAEPAQVQRVVLGENIQVTRGGNPARHVLLRAGIPVEADDYSINMNCASGLRAITSLSQDLLRDDVEVGVAAGTESMSNTPYLLEKARRGYRLGNGVLIDFLADYVLGDAGPMAEKVATDYRISREDQDRWAVNSQRQALEAIDAGWFADAIVPIDIAKKGAVPNWFSVDEHPRRGVTLEALAKLKPAFDPQGTVTAGNSSGINDGAAAFLLCTETVARDRGYAVDGYVTGWASAGVEPTLFGTGPIPAVRKLLQRASLDVADIDLIELNEAFASSTVAVIRELKLDEAKVNVNGGAIALGHPVGATGLVLVLKLLHELGRRGLRRGVVTMCVGSGQGMAVLLEAA
ncbi:MAG: thiolase family protein [Acidimicrobiales bacterium]